MRRGFDIPEKKQEPKSVKMRGGLFFSETTGAIRTKFIRNVFSSIGISHAKSKRHKGIKSGVVWFF
jgi:hypothetical protein